MTAIEEIAALKADLAKAITERDVLAKQVADEASAKAEAEAKIKADAEAKALADAEALAKSEADAKALADEKAKADEAQAELAKAEAKLRNPAFAQADIKESEASLAGAEAGVVKSVADVKAEYAAIPSNTREGAIARAAFRAEHRKELGL